jgi:hypothetical protein
MLWGAWLFGIAVVGLLFWIVHLLDNISSTLEMIRHKIDFPLPPEAYEE